MITKEEFLTYDTVEHGGKTCCYLCKGRILTYEKSIYKIQKEVWNGHKYKQYFLYFHENCFIEIAGDGWLIET